MAFVTCEGGANVLFFIFAFSLRCYIATCNKKNPIVSLSLTR
jgi:hypothetical protein